MHGTTSPHVQKRVDTVLEMDLSVKKEPNGSLRSIVEHVWTMLTQEISHVLQMCHVLVSNHWCFCNHLIILRFLAHNVHFHNSKIFFEMFSRLRMGRLE